MIFFICPLFQIITRHFYYGIFLTNTENGQSITENGQSITENGQSNTENGQSIKKKVDI